LRDVKLGSQDVDLNINALYLHIRLAKTSKLRKNQVLHLLETVDDVFADNLINTVNVLHQSKVDFKIVVGGHWCNLYSNDLSWLVDLQTQLPYTKHWAFTHRIVNRDKNTIGLKDPQYQYRTFFKERVLDENQVQSLNQWIQSQGDQVKPSGSTRRWLLGLSPSYQKYICWRHYNFDHNHLHNEIMINLMIPGLIRTTKQLVKSVNT
jgi:hypothetical protein